MKQKLLLTAILCCALLQQSYSEEPVLEFVKNYTHSYGGNSGLSDYCMKDVKYFFTKQISNGSTWYSQMEIFNDDFTLYKTINTTTLMAGARNFDCIYIPQMGDKEVFITQHLFNDDDLFEFFLYGENFGAIVNEEGKVLFFQQGNEGIYMSLIEMGNKNYLSVSNVAYNSDIYLIKKGGSSNLQMSALSKINTFPNPASEFVNISYDLQGASAGNLCITDLSGKIVDKLRIQGNENSIQYQTNKLLSGTYIFTIEVNGKQLSQEKIIVK